MTSKLAIRESEFDFTNDDFLSHYSIRPPPPPRASRPSLFLLLWNLTVSFLLFFSIELVSLYFSKNRASLVKNMIHTCNNGRLLVVLYSFIEERRWLIRATLMLIYPPRIYTSCIPHGVDNNIIHIRGCGKTDLLLLWVTYMEILPASHRTVYIYVDS